MESRGWNNGRKESAEYRRLPEARNVKETSFPLRLQKEPALPHLDVSLVKLISDSWPPEL